MKNPNHLKNLKGLAYGIVYGLIARGVIELEFNIFDAKGSGLMTMTFLFLVPFLIGLITTYKNREISSTTKVLSISMPLFAVLGVILITLIMQWEGIICVLMAIPIFAVTAMIGGYIGIQLFERKPNQMNITLILLLPFLLAPLEQQLGLSQKIFSETTTILVEGNQQAIWDNITRVYYIKEAENKKSLFQFMGFPRPLEATLDTVAVGGVRIAKFDRGLFFTETVTKVIDQQFLEFTIEADPNSIPPKALDEHVLVGGQYFDVLKGSYEIISTSEPNIYEIKLTSQFRLSTNFNFYSGFWSKLIMRDIQNNILEILKARVEQEKMAK